MRVVSLVPSATETLIAWGVDPIAVSRFCEQGDRYPTVGGTKDPDIDAIVALQPDLVVLCDQENRLPDAEAMTAHGLAIHVISITHVDHVAPQMRQLAGAVGLDPSIVDLVDPVRPPVITQRAYVPIWKRPWMTINADTYGASLLRSIGVSLVSDDVADRYPEFGPDEARLAQATVVLAPSEPYPFAERHRAELETIAPTLFVDGRDLFWWGVRTNDAQTRLRGQIDDLTPETTRA